MCRGPTGMPASVNRGSLQGPWYRISAIHTPARTSSAEWDFVTVLPAVLSSAQLGRSFVIGWLSRGGGAPLELITNAGPLAPSTGDLQGQQGLLYPHGARGTQLDDGWLAELDRMVWTPCPGRQAPPLADQKEPEPEESRQQASLFESTLVTLMGRPFAWFVIAEQTGELDTEVAELRTSLNVLRRYEEASERSRFDVERAERRMQELDTFREAGLWNVRVLAGAASATELNQIAPVLVGSIDLTQHPYRLRSGGASLPLDAALAAGAGGRENPGGPGDSSGSGDPGSSGNSGNEASYPFAATAGALGALAGLPRREVPGLRVLDTSYFDITSETSTGGQQRSVELGAVLDGQDRPVGPFTMPLATLNRHAFVTGATGAGKSQTVRHLLEQLTLEGVPWLAIEPAKSEYARMGGRLAGHAGVTVINPADPASVPMSVNPLAPEPGYPVQAHIDMVRALFQAAFDSEEPFPQIMSQALQRVYEQNGWDVVTGGSSPGQHVEPVVPTLEQLQDVALQTISDVGYGKDLMADVKGFVDVRLSSLRVGSAGRFFEGGHPVDIAELLRHNLVLAIEDVANDEDKAFLMGTLIIRIVEHLRLRARRERFDGLQHVIVIEEAHRLLRNRGEERASSHAVELFAGLLAEIRAYGEGMVVAEQIPTKLVPDVVKNTALKIVHRLPAYDDRQLVGAAMNLDDEQSRQVVSLPPGVAAVFADGMDRPLRARIPLGEGRERLVSGPQPPVGERRSPACGSQCREGRGCTLYEIREVDLLAQTPTWTWLRLWADTLVLAHLVNRPLPAVPRELTPRFTAMPLRQQQCLLATVIERCVRRRSWALRSAWNPEDLTTDVTAVARRMFATHRGPGRLAGTPPGAHWMLPQLMWMHELERMFPYGRPLPNRYDQAPRMEYEIPGVVDRAGTLLGHRVRAMRRNPLSMELGRNRAVGHQAVLGDDDHAEFVRDLSNVAIAIDLDEQMTHAARVMRVEPWLQAVLSWPRRFIISFENATGPMPFFDV